MYLRFAELGIAIFALLSWVLLLTAGTNIGTQPYRIALADPTKLPITTMLGDILLVALCYTWSNTMFLGTLASFIGGLCRWAQTEPRQRTYLSIILPGFLVYILGLGLLIALHGSSDPANPSRETYIKLAWFVSLGGFLAGYNRHFFSYLTRKGESSIKGTLGDKPPHSRPQAPDP